MSANKDLADRLRVVANFLETLPEFELESLNDLTIFTQTAEDITKLAKTGLFRSYKNDYHTTRYVVAKADEALAGIGICFMNTRELDPEEYPQEYKDEKALAAKQYLSERDQALIDVIQLLSLSGISRKQAEQIYKDISGNFKLVPLTDEEKRISKAADNVERQA